MGSENEWDGFRSWLHSIAVVTFDLELGQVSLLFIPANLIPAIHCIYVDCLGH